MKNLLIKIKSVFKKQPKKIVMVTPINPHKHWLILIRIFFVLISILIVFSLYLLYEIKNDNIFQVTPTSKEGNNLLKEDLLKKVLQSFDEKTKKESELKTNPPSYQDPSI